MKDEKIISLIKEHKMEVSAIKGRVATWKKGRPPKKEEVKRKRGRPPTRDFETFVVHLAQLE